jgi:hypothetical protein
VSAETEEKVKPRIISEVMDFPYMSERRLNALRAHDERSWPAPLFFETINDMCVLTGAKAIGAFGTRGTILAGSAIVNIEQAWTKRSLPHLHHQNSAHPFPEIPAQAGSALLPSLSDLVPPAS